MPRFNIRLLIGIGVIFMSVLMLIALALFMIARFRPAGPADQTATGGVGALPGVGEGQSGQVQEGTEGGLPGAAGGAGQGGDGTGSYAPFTVIPETVAHGGLTQATPVVQGFPLNAVVTSTGGVQYYNPRDMKFYRVTADGSEKRLLSDEEFPGVVDVEWDPQLDSGILTYADGSHVYYDFTKRRMAVLPKDMADPSFRNDGQAIVYKLETANAKNNWLIVSSPDGSGARAIQATGANGELVQTAWSPDYKIAALFRKSRGIDREEIFFIGLQEENFVSMEVQGSQFAGRWSPDGNLILYHTVLARNEYLPNIWLASAGAGGVRQQRSVGFATWIDRCAFSQDSRVLYCAVPRTLPTGAGLVPQTAADAEYDIWSYEVSTSATRLIATPAAAGGANLTGVRSLQVVPDGSALLLESFGSVYRVRLK